MRDTKRMGRNSYHQIIFDHPKLYWCSTDTHTRVITLNATTNITANMSNSFKATRYTEATFLNVCKTQQRCNSRSKKTTAGAFSSKRDACVVIQSSNFFNMQKKKT